MHRLKTELIVGLFMVAGFLSFAYQAVKLGDVGLFSDDGYELVARYTSISGLKEGAPIELAGVKIGKVASIFLDGVEYEAVVTLSIDSDVILDEDSIASIRTAGLIGDKYVKIEPGGSEQILKHGDAITETESAIDIEELISKFIFNKE